jgi:hypothetical protein
LGCRTEEIELRLLRFVTAEAAIFERGDAHVAPVARAMKVGVGVLYHGASAG